MDNRDYNDSTDGRIERAKDKALGKHDDNPSVADQVGEGVGSIGGMVAGATIGTVAGPIGTLIGGIAGAVGGWWTGRAVSEAASALTNDDDAYYRSHYESSANRFADRGYEHARPAYQLATWRRAIRTTRTAAGTRSRATSARLERRRQPAGDWSTVRPYASEGFNRGRSTLGSAAARADARCTVPATRWSAAERAAEGAQNLGRKAANAADDLKDRVDGTRPPVRGPTRPIRRAASIRADARVDPLSDQR